MSDAIHDWERLISRHLDGECTPEEKRTLERGIAEDPAVAELYREYADLDRQIHAVLHEAVSRPATGAQPVRFAERFARVGILAVAACLAVLFWFSPSNRVTPNGTSEATVHPFSHSWFAAPPATGDTLVERPARFDRPVNWVGKPKTDWIVIPTEKPREFLLIQVESIETKTLRPPYDY